MGNPAGQHGEIRFVLDTGFIGDITLPSAACVALGFRYLRPQPVSLADGSRVVLDVYEGMLVWDGATRAVEVLAADGTPLLGMTLLNGSDVRLQVADGGVVMIVPLSSP